MWMYNSGKSRSEQSLIQDVEETLNKLRRVNVKIDSSKCAFKMEEGKFLGYIVTNKGIRADPDKVQEIMRSPTLSGPEIPPELRRSWYVKEHIRFRVISSVLMQRCLRANRQSLGAETKAKLKESRTPLVGFSGKVSYPIGTINHSVTIGEPDRLQTIPMEFTIIKSHSSYNVILGRTGLRSLEDVASTIHSMIKFRTTNGIATMTTKRKVLQECQRMEEARGPTMEGRITIIRIQALESEGTTNKGREESRGQTDKVGEHDGIIQPSPIPSKKGTPTDEKDKEKHETLRSRSKTLADMTRIPRFIAEHEFKTYPHIEPRVQRKRSIALDKRKVLKDKVAKWLKAGIVRKVRYPTWVANPLIFKNLDNSWRMCIDFKDLNKACLKDLYPLPEIESKMESLMGFKYK
ncbi:hypothetical protein Tco_1037067 [Tanacetum coccineum]